MEKINPPSKIYVARSKIHGLGVFAKSNIKKNEIIEICPIVFTDIKPVSKEITPLFDYLFSYIKNNQILNQVIACGYGSLYNHSFNKNADWRLIEALDVFEFFAIRNIKKDEEILISYGPEEYWNVRKHIDII